MFEKLHRATRGFVSRLQQFVDRIWYAPLIGLLAAADNFVLVVPTDGILISSSMLTPRRWFSFASFVAVGSTVGALALAAWVEYQGLPWVREFYPGIESTAAWTWAVEFFAKYGLLVVFIVAATPLIQQPTVILAGLANTPLLQLAAVIFVGRFIKFLIMAYIGSHAPRLLAKMWGVRGELEDVGVTLKQQ